MADISKITLPSGNSYDIKDAVARQAIAGGMSKIIAWNGTSTPTVANIPAGVVVTYNGTTYTGTLAAADADATGFYFVYSSTQEEGHDIYDEYTVVGSGSSKAWEKIGDTQLDLSDLGNLAYKDNVTASPSAVTFSGGTTDKVLGSDATFSTTVTPSTTTVPNVTAAGSASTWSFAMGTGADAETLIISGANGSAPTLGTAISVVNGITSASTTTDSKDEVTAVTSIGTGTAAAQTITVS